MTISNNELIDIVWLPLTFDKDVFDKYLGIICSYVKTNHSSFANILAASPFTNPNVEDDVICIINIDKDYKNIFKNKAIQGSCSKYFIVIVGTDFLIETLNAIDKTIRKKNIERPILRPILLSPKNKYIEDELKIIEFINNNYWIKSSRKDKFKLFLKTGMNPKQYFNNFSMLLFDYFPGLDTQKNYYIFEKDLFYLHYSDDIINQLSLVSSLDYVQSVIICEKLLRKGKY